MAKNLKYLMIVIIIFVVFGFFNYQRAINTPAGKEVNNVTFTVLTGESVNNIGENLSNSGLIKSKFYFKLYTRKDELQSSLQAGEYLLSPTLTLKEIVEILSGGETITKEKTIKIIEGWRISDINKYLNENNIVLGNDFLALARTKASSWDYDLFAGAPPDADLEGFLFPDTYRIFDDATAQDIIIKMLNNLDKKLTPEMRQDIEISGRSIYEVITLASVIEKEVRTFSDMQIVSGIFLNRIKNGQPLESCATLAYILGENKKQYSIEDTKIDSEYNTYQNRGLPPGPISSPGINAIKAAIYPKDTQYNYFLNRFDNGETIFSKTYQDHLNNKAKYLD